MNVKDFVKAPSMQICFGMPTFQIGFGHLQLHQYAKYQSYKAVLFKVEREVLPNLDIAITKKLVVYQSLNSENKLTQARHQQGGEWEISFVFLKQTKSTLILEKNVLFVCIYALNSQMKCSFKSIMEKKHENFSLRSPSFVCRT